MKKSEKASWTGQMGFVLAAAGSAVGVGNIWRFPYLAAKDGGGLFLIVYLVLVVTFGYTLLVNDLGMGRKTGLSSVRAYQEIRPGWGFLGKLTFLVPALIMTYYAIIGGWIVKYIGVYFTGASKAAADSSYFTGFITSPVSPVVYALIFMALTALIVYLGVEKGIELVSKFIMPVLLVMIIGIVIYCLTLHHTDAKGVTRNGLQGLAVYLIPDFTGLTPGRFLQVLLDAMSQLFFSLSVSMGIMITYGSYVKKDVNMNRSVTQIEVFDTLVAFLAGAMIVPAIYIFTGSEGMSAGPGLVFVSLPKVFSEMGTTGRVIGAAFFIMFAFAALTSCISVMETLVANCMEIFHASRKKVTLVLAVIYAAATVVVCMGYTVFYFELPLPNGSTAQLLDVMDYISNSFLMPLISFLNCILIGWLLKPGWIIDEMEASGDRMRRKRLYTVMVRYVAPVIMLVLFLQSTGLLNYIFR